ncbi:MAG: GAK system XXXCH domain-containing protein [Desulfosarcinaceae bacterium]|nr:GAK system XXXCH domain-containing protein [Desulfosarcinaceae bacterium]
MKNGDHKRKLEMAPEAVPAFLRELAAAMAADDPAEDGHAPGDLEQLVRDYRKISLQIKRKADQVRLKLKIKPPEVPADAGMAVAEEISPIGGDKDSGPIAEAAADIAADAGLEEQKPKYKRLKKRMKSTFKEIRASLEELRLPEEEIVRQFCEDSALMVTYPGKGDPHYAAYTQAVGDLRAAYDRKDFAGFKSVTSNLADLKNACHKAYK